MFCLKEPLHLGFRVRDLVERERAREIYARIPCIVVQRGIVGRVPWCKDYTGGGGQEGMERRRKKGNIAGQWFGLGRESVTGSKGGGSGGMEMDKRGEPLPCWWRVFCLRGLSSLRHSHRLP